MPDEKGNVHSEADRMRARGESREVTIEAASALTQPFRLRGRRVAAIAMPADWTAADITVLAGPDENNLQPVYDDEGAEVVITADADRVIAITGARADAIMALDWVQLRSGTNASPVNQADERTLTLLLK